MSKISERIAELDKATKKSRTINTILWVFVFCLVGVAGYYAYSANVEREKAETLANEKKIINQKLIDSEAETKRKLDSIIRLSVTDLWEQAKNINTLSAYSNYAKENPNDSIHGDDLINAVDHLLNKSGFTQYQETNGNKLFNPVNLDLEGSFVTFKTDKAVRNGAIGINDCGASNSRKIDVIVQGEIVRIKRLCEAPGSKSIWAEIEYSN
ncbi:MAG: hypothetical protein ED555_13495 [Allomuricauda sp.]|nr:MAG: hypothetical protein ED555_13495 [Allomuricauda sp.]